MQKRDATRHTPEPWTAEFGEVVSVLDKDRGRVCTINWLRGPHGSFGRRPDSEGEANARLIATAPELLDACRVALGHMTGGLDGDYRDCDPRDVLRAAIEKATGRQ